MPPTAFVMNMFYTGLGIARSLGRHGIPVVGLSAHRRIYGNYTRYAKIVSCPDSREHPEELCEFLLDVGSRLDQRAVIFPTRDDDTMFLDRFREQLQRFFSLVIPPSEALRACLNKWETYQYARAAGAAPPRCWLIESAEDLPSVLSEATFPCVLKPIAAHHWRKGNNWDLVGARKAVAITSPSELEQEYQAVARADQRALVQEMIPGGDDALFIAACYLDRESRWVAGFNTQKLAQSPPVFGTGCVVQTVNRPELFEPARRLLETMHFSGIAEVEYKWDDSSREYKLIEVNPRPWDQHSLGRECGVDLIHLAYCDHAGLPRPAMIYSDSPRTWIAEDTFVNTVLLMVWRRQAGVWSLVRLARPKRVYAIWEAHDPLPLIAYLIVRFVPDLIVAGFRAVWRAVKRRSFRPAEARDKSDFHERHIQDAKAQR
jgi:predicted ATP-grasp superfamily ATP-dependent carboligase